MPVSTCSTREGGEYAGLGVKFNFTICVPSLPNPGRRALHAGILVAESVGQRFDDSMSPLVIFFFPRVLLAQLVGIIHQPRQMIPFCLLLLRRQRLIVDGDQHRGQGVLVVST